MEQLALKFLSENLSKINLESQIKYIRWSTNWPYEIIIILKFIKNNGHFEIEPTMTMMKTMTTISIMIGHFSPRIWGICTMIMRKGICHNPKGICYFHYKTKIFGYEDLKIAPSIAFFIDHEKEVLICSISADNGQIVS